MCGAAAVVCMSLCVWGLLVYGVYMCVGSVVCMCVYIVSDAIDEYGCECVVVCRKYVMVVCMYMCAVIVYHDGS